MESDPSDSVSQWIGALKGGDQEAVQRLWERYYARLVGLARARLQQRRRNDAALDEEDAALSAFHSFCEGATRGRFPRLADRDDLWKLLVVITTRKAGAHAQRAGRQKRGGGRVVGEAQLAVDLGDRARSPLDMIAGPDPDPEFAAQIAEEAGRLLDLLDDPELRRIAIERMEGYSVDEIAERLGCARRTVARRLNLIRIIWGGGEDS